MQSSKKEVFFVLGTVLAALVSVVFLISCSPDEQSLKDGYYSAEMAEFDSYGWKEYVTVCVSGGRIILVEYDAFNNAGFVKSWDMDYMRVMNSVDGTYPNAYTRYYGGQFLKNQGAQGVDVLSGATHSYYSFLQLAEAALENARRGDASTRLVSMGVPETQ